MKIATHNVEFLFGEGEHTYGGKKWIHTKEYVEGRIEHLGSLFSKIDADVLFLQEVASVEVIRKIIERSGKNYNYFLAKPDHSGVGNAVLYKQKDSVCDSIPATTSMPVFIEGDIDTIGPRIWSRRDFVRMVIHYKGKRLTLLGIHLKTKFLMPLKKDTLACPMETQITSADGLIRSEMFTLTQARKVRELVDEVFVTDKEGSVIVVGDFNSTETDTPFRVIRGEITNLSDSLISLASLIPEQKRFSIIPQRQIDHILISKNLESQITSFKILNENLSSHAETAPTRLSIESDHAPLVIELT